MTSSWFFLSTLNYDARSATHQIHGLSIQVREKNMCFINKKIKFVFLFLMNLCTTLVVVQSLMYTLQAQCWSLLMSERNWTGSEQTGSSNVCLTRSCCNITNFGEQHATSIYNVRKHTAWHQMWRLLLTWILEITEHVTLTIIPSFNPGVIRIYVLCLLLYCNSEFIVVAWSIPVMLYIMCFTPVAYCERSYEATEWTGSSYVSHISLFKVRKRNAFLEVWNSSELINCVSMMFVWPCIADTIV